MDLILTPSATKRIAELIEAKGQKGLMLRISVNGGGCSGFMYKYDIVAEEAEDDYVLVQDGVKLVVDAVSQPFLEGAVVDFVQELGNSYFQIKNPNATAKCGCGSSFAV